MADIKFYAGENFQIQELSGSGLGFYGDGGFGASIPVGEYQGRTFITNSTGTTQGPEVDNVKYLNPASGILGQVGSGVGLLAIPNYLSTLNLRFTHSTAVKIQNAQLRIYDRLNINNAPSGVVAKVAEIIHPDTTQVSNGSGDTVWITAAGSSMMVDLANSPGTSGLSPNGANTTDVQHDWYIAMSVLPSSIGSKLFAAYVSLEYL